jgi:GT2 family glycosyltransferase
LDLLNSLNKQNLNTSEVEVIVVYDDDQDLGYLETLLDEKLKFKIKLIPYSPPFNFSKKSNLGASNASGSVLLFLNDDTEFIAQNSLLELAGTATLLDVGAVGAKLYFENKSIQHAGIVVIDRNLGHAYFKSFEKSGPFGDLTSIHEVSGVTGACFAQRKEVWQKTGGWDESFKNSYNDVEYCFRLRNQGFSILQNNHAELFHFESLTRDATYSQSAKENLEQKWENFLMNDPYFPQFVSKQLQQRRLRNIVKKILRKFNLK